MSPHDQHGGTREASRLSGNAEQALPLTPGEDRRWATIAQLFGLAGFLPSLIIYLVYRDRGPFTAQESREALNFTLPLSLLLLLFFGLSFVPVVGGVFALLAVAVWLYMTVQSIIAGIQVNKGRPYLYRLNLRLI